MTQSPKESAEKAWEQYGKGIRTDIQRRNDPFWSSDKHWFKEGYAAGRSSREPLRKAIDACIMFDAHFRKCDDCQSDGVCPTWLKLWDKAKTIVDKALAQDAEAESSK